jgi:hypothetical protein
MNANTPYPMSVDDAPCRSTQPPPKKGRMVFGIEYNENSKLNFVSNEWDGMAVASWE